MRLLFIHQNFPGQFRHLAAALAADPQNAVYALGESTNMRRQAQPQGVQLLGYEMPAAGDDSGDAHPYLRQTTRCVRRGQAVARALLQMKQQGVIPDLVAAHPGWGEALYIRDVFPDAKILDYCEFFYRTEGTNFNFDPEFPASFDARLRVRTESATYLLSLESMDRGIAPTLWQRDVHPVPYHDHIDVIHDGIDTAVVRPDPEATVQIDATHTLSARDEVLTYVARNLEPSRGFHIFMRALPEILARRPQARVLIVGGDELSYSRKSSSADTYRQQLLEELGDRLDRSRVHFLGKLPYKTFLKVLQVSRCHVYLTYPFVLSWSLMEAMAAGCAIVASHTRPVEEMIVDGQTGCLVDFFDTAVLAERVCAVLDRPDEFKPMRAAARQHIIDHYDLLTHCLPAQRALVDRLLQ